MKRAPLAENSQGEPITLSHTYGQEKKQSNIYTQSGQGKLYLTYGLSPCRPHIFCLEEGRKTRRQIYKRWTRIKQTLKWKPTCLSGGTFHRDVAELSIAVCLGWNQVKVGGLSIGTVIDRVEAFSSSSKAIIETVLRRREVPCSLRKWVHHNAGRETSLEGGIVQRNLHRHSGGFQ